LSPYLAAGVKEQGPVLDRWEMRILDALRSERMQEKAIAKHVRLDGPIVADLITGLMFKGYVERRGQKWMLFFSREYFLITLEGVAALEAARGDLDRIMEILKERGEMMANRILDELPPFASMTLRATYRAAKFILK
jgi:hypothetical protein